MPNPYSDDNPLRTRFLEVLVDHSDVLTLKERKYLADRLMDAVKADRASYSLEALARAACEWDDANKGQCKCAKNSPGDLKFWCPAVLGVARAVAEANKDV